MNDDGTVDFHTLENVNHIRKGEVVAVLHPEDRGTPGEDLLGRKVMPKKGKTRDFPPWTGSDGFGRRITAD